MISQTNYSFQQSALLSDVRAQSEDGFLDYAGFGTASVVISGGVGLVNTIIGLGETLGVVDEGSQLDEARSVTTIFGQDAGDFYLRHKQGVDVLGLVASSIIPGVAGVKALRLAQRTGKIYDPLHYSTGARNADILLGSPQVQAAKNAALANKSSSLLSAEYGAAIGAGFKQQVMENIAFSAGMIVFNNQNTTMNPDDLSYFEAAGSQLVHDLPWIAVGAGVGTAIDALRIGGAVRKGVQEETNRVVFTTEAGKEVTAGALRNLAVPELRGMTAGDAMIALAADSTAAAKIKQSLYAVDGNGNEYLPDVNKFAYNNLMDAGNIRNSEFMKQVTSINKAGKEGFNLVKGLYDDMATGVADSKYALAALDEIKYVTPKAIKDVDTATIVSRKLMDKEALSLESLEALTPKALADMPDNMLLGTGTRLMQAGTKHHDVVAEVMHKRFPNLFNKEIKDPVQAQLQVNKVMQQVDELVEAGRLSEELASAIPAMNLKAFANVTTKEVRSKIVPRLADFGKTKVINVKGVPSLYSGATRETLGYKADAFAAATTGKIADGAVVLPSIKQLDANWHLAHSIKPAYDKPLVQIAEGDLARMEKIINDAVDPKNTKASLAFQENRIQLGNQAVTLDTLRTKLVEGKSRLIANLQEQGFNADEIAIAANTKQSVVLGEEGLNASNVVGRTTYDSPEWVQVGYTNRSIKDYNKQVDDFTAQAQRTKLYNTQKEIALQQLAPYGFAQKLPTVTVEEISTLATTEERTGMFKRLNAAFGSVREKFAYIGKQVNEEVKRSDANVAGDFAAFENKINKPENGLLRAELELATNFLRTGDMTLVNNVIVKLTPEVRAAIKELEATGDGAMLDEVVSSLGKGDVISVSDDLIPVFQHWKKVQQESMNARVVIAETLGTHINHDPLILRAPPVNLSQYRMQAFARPKTAHASNDPTSYMIYAQTAEELNAKIAEAQIKLGDKYNIVRKGEDQDFYRAMQQYESGHEFRDLFADINKTNKGKTSDALPPLGDATSRALNDMKLATMRNGQYQIRATVELQNSEAMEALRRYGDFVDNAERTATASNYTKKGRHIYNDSVAVMLDLPGYKGNGIEVWNGINTAVAQRGSKVIDFISAQGTVLTEATQFIADTYKKFKGKEVEARVFNWDAPAMAELTRMMSERGYVDPLLPVTDLIVKSTDPAVSNSASQLSRSLATLVSTAMLRADPTHSMLQLTGATILSLPVLKELQKTLPEIAAKLTGVRHPTEGFIEPNIVKIYAKGNALVFSKTAESTEFLQALKDRGIVKDYINQSLDMGDMSVLNGSHTVQDVNSVLNRVGQFVSKWSGHTKSEEMARVGLAYTVKEMCKARGIPEKEMWPIISNAVDKTHGNYIASQRPQLFNGVIGQNVGLFQTYFFNMMQHLTRHIGDGNGRMVAITAAMQGSMFGAQSIPGFSTLNALVARSANYEDDLYSLSDANTPGSWQSYGMFGLGSQAFGIDFSGRGNLNPRYASIVPTDFENLATVNVVAGAVGNLWKTAGMIADGNTSTWDALAHGLAHNGMNRPLQGLGTIMQNAVTSGTGQVDIANANMDPAGNLAYASIFARLIGAKPMDEAMTRSHFYRQAGYQAAHKDKMAELGATIQQGGVEDWGQIATEYESAGGDLQQFNAFIAKHMQTASDGKLSKFRREMEEESALNRAVTRMQYRDSLTPYWE